MLHGRCPLTVYMEASAAARPCSPTPSLKMERKVWAVGEFSRKSSVCRTRPSMACRSDTCRAGNAFLATQRLLPQRGLLLLPACARGCQMPPWEVIGSWADAFQPTVQKPMLQWGSDSHWCRPEYCFGPDPARWGWCSLLVALDIVMDTRYNLCG